MPPLFHVSVLLAKHGLSLIQHVVSKQQTNNCLQILDDSVQCLLSGYSVFKGKFLVFCMLPGHVGKLLPSSCHQLLLVLLNSSRHLIEQLLALCCNAHRYCPAALICLTPIIDICAFKRHVHDTNILCCNPALSVL